MDEKGGLEVGRFLFMTTTPISDVPSFNSAPCVCMWLSRNDLVTSDIWRLVRSSESMSTTLVYITKIQRVCRSTDNIRFDFYADKSKLEELFLSLAEMRDHLSKRQRHRYGAAMTLKRHVPFWARRQQKDSVGEVVRPRELVPTSNSSAFHLCSLNICSAKRKLSELGDYAKANNLGVICVQETRFTTMDVDICMKDYRSFSVPSVKGKPNRGKVGLCTLVHKSKPAILWGKWQSPFNVVTKVWLGDLVHYFVNLYIPCEGTPHRGQAIDDLTRRFGDIEAERHISSVVVAIGDWNMKPEKVDEFLAEWTGLIQLRRLVPKRDPRTYHKPNVTWSALDHVVVNGMATHLSAPWVDRSCDMSDHWPLRLTLPSAATKVPIPRVANNAVVVQKIDVDALHKARPRFCNNNKFRVLADKLGDDDGDDGDDGHEEGGEEAVEHLAKAGYQAFVDTVLDVAKTNKLLKRVWKQRKGPKFLLPQKCRRAIMRRKVAHKGWVAASMKGSDTARGLWERYMKLRKVARAAVAQVETSARAKAIAKSVTSLRKGAKASKVFWKSLKGIMGKKVDDSGKLLGPVLDGEGNIQFGSDATKVWEEYTMGLLADVSGHSKDKEYWTSPEKFGNTAASPPLSVDINKDISWDELNDVLRNLPRHKAPGPDTIPYEVLKLACENNANNNPPAGPQTPFGNALLKLCNSMFKHGICAEANVTLMTYIYKKGSVMDPSNFRGIALINTIVKLVTVVVEKRARGALEEADFLIEEQAGFRSKEECMTQVVAFYEVICRRSLAEKNTFVAFVDFKKAYDLVPHEAVLAKLRLAGLHGSSLNFLSSLYSGGSLRLKVDGAPGAKSIDVLRGVRQGCNMSPLAFDIFINDILDTRGDDGKSIRDLGVTIASSSDMTVSGLLFADDLAVIAPRRKKLLKGLRLLGVWARRHEMQFGCDKCGIMGFGPTGQVKAKSWNDRWSFDVLGREKVSVVDKYTYLGCLVTHDPERDDGGIDLYAMAQARANVAEGTLNKIAPVLKDLSIPSVIKVNLVKATLVPCIAFGAELWGMSTSRGDYGNRVLVRAAKLILGGVNGRGASYIQVDPNVLLTELGLPSIHAVANASRARAYYKYPTLKTIISKVVAVPSVGRMAHWVKGTKRYLETYYEDHSRLGTVRPQNPATLSQRVAAFVKNAQHKRELSLNNVLTGRPLRNPPATLSRYVLGNFGDNGSGAYIKQAIAYPFLVRGVTILSLFRSGGITLARKNAFNGRMAATYRDKCPCCGKIVVGGESRVHLMLYCDKWDSLRGKYLSTLIQQVCCDIFAQRFPDQLSVDEQRTLVNVLLGGGAQVINGVGVVVGYKIKDWVLTFPEGRTGVSNTQLLPTVHSIDQLTRDHMTQVLAFGVVVLPRFVTVACFLQEVFLVRKRILKALLPSSRAEAQRGMAVVVPLRILDGAPDNRPGPHLPR